MRQAAARRDECPPGPRRGRSGPGARRGRPRPRHAYWPAGSRLSSGRPGSTRPAPSWPPGSWPRPPSPGWRPGSRELSAEQAEVGAELIRLARGAGRCPGAGGARGRRPGGPRGAGRRRPCGVRQRPRAGCRPRGLGRGAGVARRPSVLDLSRGLEHLASASGRAEAEAARAGFIDLADARSALLATAGARAPRSEPSTSGRPPWPPRAPSSTQPELRAVAGRRPGRGRPTTLAGRHGRARAASSGVARAAHEEATVASRQRERFTERLAEVQACAAATGRAGGLQRGARLPRPVRPGHGRLARA